MKVQVHAADLGGCGHYRMIWPATACHYNDVADVDIRTMDDGGGAAFELRVDPAASAAAGRPVLLEEFAAVPDADVVVLQRPLTAGLVTVVKALKRAGIAVVVEVDDDFERIDPRNTAWPTVQPGNEHITGRNYRHLAECCELADLVTVSTPRLAGVYGRHGRVRVIRNYVPTAYLHIEPPVREPGDVGVRLGWSGNIDTHPNDLPQTRGAVGRLCRELEVPFHVIGANDARLTRALGLSAGTKVASTGGWLPLAKYPVGMSLLDVGVVPLDLTPFNEAKSWLKGLEFAAVGVAFAASPTAEYRELAQLGAGVIVDKPRQWYPILRRLAVDDDYRAELAQAGKRAAARLVIEEHLDEYGDAWRTALDNSARNRVLA